MPQSIMPDGRSRCPFISESYMSDHCLSNHETTVYDVVWLEALKACLPVCIKFLGRPSEVWLEISRVRRRNTSNLHRASR